MALKKRAKFSRESRYWPLLRQESEGIKLVPKGAISQDPNWHIMINRSKLPHSKLHCMWLTANRTALNRGPGGYHFGSRGKLTLVHFHALR